MKMLPRVLWAVCCFVPLPALANAGTPLLWLTFFHLLLGNFLLGVLEGAVLARWAKVSPGYAVLAMVAANYLSGFAGFLLINGLDLLDWFTIYTLQQGLAVLIVLAWLLTVLLEWPLVAWLLLRKPALSTLTGRQLKLRQPGPLRRSWSLNWRLQLGSYLVLAALYIPLGNYGVLQLQMVPLQEMSLPEGVSLYYLSPDRRTVLQRPLKASQGKAEVLLQSTQPLSLQLSDPSDTADWAWLIASHKQEGDAIWRLRVPRSRMGACSLHRRDYGGSAPRLLRPDASADCSSNYTMSVWAAMGLRHRSFYHGLETGVGSWYSKAGTELPDDQVVYQLGGEQIVLFDAQSRRMALVALGADPIVLWQHP